MYQIFMNSTLGYLLQIIPFVLVVGAVYLLARHNRLQKQGLARKSLADEAVRFLFVCYVAGLLALVWVPANFWSSIWFFVLNGYSGGSMGAMFTGEFNFIPSFLRDMTAGEAWDWRQIMAVGNVLMYLPFGLLVPFLWKRANWWRMLLLGLGLSAILELGQPVFGRSFDVDDLIANAVGAFLGFLLFSLVKRLAPKDGRLAV